MAKYYGNVGYINSEETSPGVWEEVSIERKYFGDFIRNSRLLQSGDKINDNINISNEISIVSDLYANENFHNIRYITYQGVKWKVSSVEIRYPRLILSIGGIYNG